MEDVDIKNPFGDVFRALDLKEQRRALQSAMRKEGNRIKKDAASAIASSGLGGGTQARVSKGLRVRVYPERYGAGFMVSAKPHGKKGYHKNRQRKEKPVLMWAEDGTKQRRTKTKTKMFVRQRKGHDTGKMPRYGFMKQTEERATAIVEKNLLADLDANIEKRARKLGLV